MAGTLGRYNTRSLKALANQTSRATEDIADKISEIQSAAKNTADEINSIAARISELTEIASNIATSVDEQSWAALEIGRGMQTAADQTSLASSAVKTVETTVHQGTMAATEISKWTELLSAGADDS